MTLMFPIYDVRRRACRRHIFVLFFNIVRETTSGKAKDGHGKQ
jgi:hypothetical protein